MAKIHFTKLDNPFKLIFGDFKTNFKYLAPTAFFAQLFYILALLPKYFEKIYVFYPIPFLVVSLISTIIFCGFFWKFIQKNFGLCLIAKAKIEGNSFDTAEIDFQIKEKTKPLVRFLSFGAVAGVLAIAVYLILTFFAYKLATVLYDGPFLAISNFFYMNNVALLVSSFAVLFVFLYFLARFFGFSMQSFLFDENSAITPYKNSWNMLNRNVFAIFFPVVALTLISYLPILILFNLVSYIFAFSLPTIVAIITDVINSTLFLILSTLFTVYILTSAYLKAKD